MNGQFAIVGVEAANLTEEDLSIVEYLERFFVNREPLLVTKTWPILLVENGSPKSKSDIVISNFPSRI